MAGRDVRGITVEIGGDTTKLQSALQQREDEEIIYYEEKRSAEDAWKAEAADVLEDN